MKTFGPWLKILGKSLKAQPGRVMLGCFALRRVYWDRLIADAGEPMLLVNLSGTRALIA